MRPIRILFQGDSITDGNRYKEESQRWDLNHQIGHSWAYVIAASLGYRYPQRFEFINRAITSRTVIDLEAAWEKDTIEEKPDVLFLLIGTNDCSFILRKAWPDGITTYGQGLTRLLSRAREANPDLKLVLLEPFRYPDSEEAAACMEDVRAVARRIAGDFGAVYIPLQEEFDRRKAENGAAYWIWDGIHPTVAGHGMIAAKVLEQTEEELLRLTEE